MSQEDSGDTVPICEQFQRNGGEVCRENREIGGGNGPTVCGAHVEEC